MATQQNSIKAKSESNQRATVATRFGNDVVDIFDEEVNDEWEVVESFKQRIDNDD